MIIDDQNYDLIIIGTGAGGGTLAYKLASTGKKILILERGDFMPLEEQNRSNVDIFKRERYHAPEQWYDSAGEPFSPQMNYAVGGNTKIYGAALLRFREGDFETVQHQGGISPEWCLKYSDFEPYYTEAETLYKVHGQANDDPTEPPRSGDYPFPAVATEPQVAQIYKAIAKLGLHPAPLPLALTRQDDDPTNDSEVSGIAPALTHPNVTLKTGAKVVRLHINPSGRVVKGVQAEIDGQSHLFLGDIVVLACGAVNSAALLLRSVSDRHPNGLANSSGLVGRNLMKSLMTVVVQLSTKPNSGAFQKTVCVNDFYWGDDDFPYPMGHIQNSGGLLTDIIFAEAPPMFSLLAKFMPGFGLKQLATHSIGWWAQTEDLPDPNNRVRFEGGKLFIDYSANNNEAHDRLIYRWTEVLKTIEKQLEGFQQGVLHPRGEVPIQVMANQCGTCCFGDDPQTSVLDPNCRAHDLDNLYVVDGSFFPSNAGVSPALTIIANALRVGDRLIERLQ
ncbi:6'''-hydroxyparomomycin C oxidase [Planktothrix agardhii]|jgi:choline dehydrogenase-like flavoprotein|uniref:GMC oxidoreductase n=2 Tax=Planktothrix agardhii TaxID=1160 RepID=A0A1J1JKZ8_PLAAG|nr:GMC family oxidoreductase [Planktothrix agardhii]AQY61148.1 GMC oxidoreductase [Planktothrix agardhii NIVA-CYA 68]CAD5915349.1 6'''-hydroxyparomomycin C oxidase [Planktothrix agardhii]CUM61995.1 GMC oxidoreductase [Planktothrix agardhii]